MILCQFFSHVVNALKKPNVQFTCEYLNLNLKILNVKAIDMDNYDLQVDKGITLNDVPYTPYSLATYSSYTWNLKQIN